MNEFKRFKNVKNIPDVDGSRPKRMSLEVTKDGVPTNRYWKRRFLEDCIEPMDDKVSADKNTPEPKLDPLSKSVPNSTSDDKSSTVKKDAK